MDREKDEAASDARHEIAGELMPHDWDLGAWKVASIIRDLLMDVVDAGTGIDSGGGNGMADLWAKFGGIEYLITIEKSNKQKATD